MNDEDESYTIHHALKDARGCAFKTIKCIRKDSEDSKRALSDIDIDKVKDSMQILMYCRELEKSCMTK